MKIIIIPLLLLFLIGCDNTSTTGTYTPGYITSSGKYRKGHFKKRHSTNPNAVKNRLSSQRYYHFKGGKQRRKNK
jgi:hypothetical protein